MKKITALALIMFSLFLGCKKDSNQYDPIDETPITIEQDPLFFSWAESANGRWMPYSMELLDASRLNKDNSFELLNGAVEPVYYARKHYERLMLAKYGTGTADFQGLLDSLYRINYRKITSGLKKRSVMDSLYKDYKKLMPVRRVEKLMSKEKAGLFDIPEVVVFACRIPASLVNFFNINLNWPMFPIDQGGGATGNCRQRALNAVSNAMGMLRTTYTNSSIAGNGAYDCENWAREGYDAMLQYYNCDPYGSAFNGDSPDDPFAPSYGIPSLPSLPPDFTFSSNTRPCITQMVNALKSASSIRVALQYTFRDPLGIDSDLDEVADMFDKVATRSDYGLHFQEAVFTGNDVNANAITSFINHNLTTRFSTSYLNQATDLAIARTIIHETLHAYFTYGLAYINDPGYPLFEEANSLLFDKEGSVQDNQNKYQHELIASKYVMQLSDLLYDYALSRGMHSPVPGLSLLEYCMDLSWGGLNGTKAYRKYAPNKSRIEQNLLKEQTNAPNSTGVKGC